MEKRTLQLQDGITGHRDMQFYRIKVYSNAIIIVGLYFLLELEFLVIVFLEVLLDKVSVHLLFEQLVFKSLLFVEFGSRSIDDGY